MIGVLIFFFFSSRRRHTRLVRDWSSDVCSSDLHGWSIENFPNTGDLPLYGFARLAKEPRLTVYISTGIHGDEPAGPLALVELLEANAWPSGVNLIACPCLNPTGFPNNTRENRTGTDLNRDYRHIETREVQAHTEIGRAHV